MRDQESKDSINFTSQLLKKTRILDTRPMNYLLLTLTFLSLSSFADDGLTIANSHRVDKSGNVYRGREPKQLVDELAHFGVSDVIIFKNDVKGETTTEIKRVQELGMTPHHIPFQWKDFKSMTEACEQTIEALNIIQDVKSKNGKVFFHCTAGEDRTGMLAGLYRMLDEKLSVDVVFKDEMCARGYSNGNKKKPRMVSSAIEKELTPLFISLSGKIASGEWKAGKLKKSSCKDLLILPTTLKCL
jgi:protein-tyrosine phosphatase